MSRGLHAQAVSADHQGDALQTPVGEIFGSILSSSAETTHPHKPQSYSHIINSYFPVSLYPGTHSSIPGQCPPSALVTDWSQACEPSSALIYLKKKGDSVKPTTLLKAFLFFPGAKEKCNVSTQAQGGESYMWSKSKSWLWHWQFSPALGKSPRNFCGYCSFLMSLMLRMPFSLRAQSAVFLAWLCSGLHHFKAVNGLISLPPHLQNGDNTTCFRIFCRPIFAKHFEKWKVLSKHWMLATEPASRILKAFYILSYKSFIPASSANICSGLKTSALVTEMVALVK